MEKVGGSEGVVVVVGGKTMSLETGLHGGEARLKNGWLGTASFKVINKTQTLYRSMTQAGLSAGRYALADIDLHTAPVLLYGFSGKEAQFVHRLWRIRPVRPVKVGTRDGIEDEKDIFTVCEGRHGSRANPLLTNQPRTRGELSGSDRCQRRGEVSLSQWSYHGVELSALS